MTVILPCLSFMQYASLPQSFIRLKAVCTRIKYYDSLYFCLHHPSC